MSSSPADRAASSTSSSTSAPPGISIFQRVAARYRRFDPSGWVGLLSLFLAANVVAGNRAFTAITEETRELEREREALRAQASALDSSLLQLHERIQSLFKGEAAKLQDTPFARRIRSVFEGVGSLEPGYDVQLGLKLVRSIVKDEGAPRNRANQ